MKQALLVIDVQNEYFTVKTSGNISSKKSGKYSGCYGSCSYSTAAGCGDPAYKPGTGSAHVQERNGRVGTSRCDTTAACGYHNGKNLPGSFTGTKLGPWLEGNAISNITIAGYMTRMCCDTTARQAFHRGYAVNFLSDATGTLSCTNTAGSISDADLHSAILVTQQQRFSRVLTTAEWNFQS